MLEIDQNTIDIIADQIIAGLGVEAALEIAGGTWEQYKNDPVGFAQDVLGISLTPDVVRMMESVRDNRITVCRSATGTGKSHGSAVAAIWFYKCFRNSRAYTIANPYENQKILWGEISDQVNRHTDLFATDKVLQEHISRSAKDFIEALTVPTTGSEEVREGKFSGKHHENMLFIVDEGDTVPDFAYRGIEGCMSGGFVRLLILYNPRYQAGTPYRMERDGLANVIHLTAFNHPNVITGETIIPGAVDRETTVQRINDYCRPLAEGESITENCFKLPDFLVGATANYKNKTGIYPPLVAGHYFVNEQAFWYLVHGEFPPQPEQQLISREWVNNARTRWDSYVAVNGEVPPFGVSPLLGADIAEQGKDSNVRALRYGGWIPRLRKWNGMDPDASASILTDDYKDYGCTMAFIDATGVGAGVAPKMQRTGCTAVGVKVAERPTRDCELGKFAQLRDQLYWTFREWLRTDPGAMLPPDEKLIQQCLTPTYAITNGRVKVMPKNPTEGKVCMRDLLKGSPDEMDSVTMTFASENYIVNGMDLS